MPAESTPNCTCSHKPAPHLRERYDCSHERIYPYPCTPEIWQEVGWRNAGEMWEAWGVKILTNLSRKIGAAALKVGDEDPELTTVGRLELWALKQEIAEMLQQLQKRVEEA